MRLRGGAAERVLRVVALLFGVAALVFGGLTLPLIAEQAAGTPAWWTTAALVVVLGGSVALSVAAPVASAAALRRIAGAVAAGYLLALASLPAAMPASATHDATPWPLALTAIGTTAAALAWPPVAAWAAALGVAALVGVDRVATAAGDLRLVAAQDAGYALVFCAVFTALVLGSLRAGRAVDRASATASAAAVDAALGRLRQDERARVDALVHDRVLATLLLAGRGVADDPLVVRQAVDALAQLRTLSAAGDGLGSVAVPDLADRLRAEATAIAPFAEVVAAVGADAAPVSEQAAEAVLGAAGEALRNTVRHAGDGASVLVDLRADAAGVVVAVVDDGVGFDPGSVPSVRLGIASSIVGRVRSAGGEAHVRSQPGRGTAVSIRMPAA